MTGRNIASRITRLEDARGQKIRRQYVYHVSNPATPEENAAIASATGPIVIVPHACKTVEEWVAQHAPNGVAPR
jgi:hypothetical protein